nr:GntR family transcriptional regulator [Williamsia sp. CHRR-6]
MAALTEITSGTPPTVVDGLRQVILDGGAPPGSPLPVATIADKFKVSPIPVREALKRLVGEGLVGHQTNGGYFVAQLTADELREIYFVRGVLEQAALARAAETAGPADIEAARAAHESLLRASEFSDARAYHQQSRVFHRALIAPCGMQRLLHMVESTWNVTEPFQLMRVATPEMVAQLHIDHEQLLTAMTGRDAQTLIAVAKSHHAHLESIIVDSVTKLGVAHPET